MSESPTSVQSTTEGSSVDASVPSIPSEREHYRSAVWSECSALFDATMDESLRFEFGDLVAYVRRDKLFQLLSTLKNSSYQFGMLVDVTAVDWLDSREHRFEVVYQLLSIERRARITVKVAIPESSPEVESATPLWKSANFLEREMWDMFGIKAKGHPELKRILLYEEFVGHPLKKDYPVQAKQPRVPLRKPEVENTARQMKRSDLVAIRGRKSAVGAE